MKKKTIRLLFTDFWRGFKPTDNFFYHLLSRRYTVEISPNPDCVIFSGFKLGFAHLFPFKYKNYPKAIRIFFTGENQRSPGDCDYSFTFDYPETEKNFRLPLYTLYGGMDKLIFREARDIDALVASKTRFCNFVYSNRKAKERIRFFNKLSRYKKVDSAGRVLNNMGGRISNKREFLSHYKFTIAFENAFHPGYTTEKIIDPMLVASIPIYWGNPKVNLDFNTDSFINWNDYGSDEAVIDRVIAIDRDEELYRHYLAQPYFPGNTLSPYADEERALRRFTEIIEKHDIAR